MVEEEGFANRLIYLMAKEKVKNKDLMEHCSVSNAAVSQWRSGGAKPKDFLALSKAFNKDPDELKNYLLYGIEFQEPTEKSWFTQLSARFSVFFSSKENHKLMLGEARAKLQDIGFNVTPFVKGKNSRLLLMNRSMWASPTFNIYLPERDITFVIDIYSSKKLGIPRNLDNKFQEFLFIKETEIDNIVEIVQNHIQRWFS